MAVIASQNFNAISSSASETSDQISSGSPLTNAGASHTSTGGTDLGFQSFFFDTRGNDGGLGPVTTTMDTSDFIGVNASAGGGLPDVAADGTDVAAGTEHNFRFNDSDGRIDLVFDTLDLSDFSNRVFSLDFFISETGFESNDSFSITVSDGTTTVTILNFGEAELEGNASADDGTANWNGFSIDLDPIIVENGLDASNLTVTISADTNASAENIFVDNILFEGDDGGDTGGGDTGGGDLAVVILAVVILAVVILAVVILAVVILAVDQPLQPTLSSTKWMPTPPEPIKLNLLNYLMVVRATPRLTALCLSSLTVGPAAGQPAMKLLISMAFPPMPTGFLSSGMRASPMWIWLFPITLSRTGQTRLPCLWAMLLIFLMGQRRQPSISSMPSFMTPMTLTMQSF